LIKTAVLSQDGVYRYSLVRMWPAGCREDDGGATTSVLFVLLNPSTADAEKDDPTIRRLLGFARIWGMNMVEVVNLFALRATDPVALNRHPDPVGPLNDEYIAAGLDRAGAVVCGWGAQPDLGGRDRHVHDLLWARAKVPITCLGTTKEGHPRHPLYLRNDAVRVPYHGPSS
jgi:hypothetical protein